MPVQEGETQIVVSLDARKAARIAAAVLDVSQVDFASQAIIEASKRACDMGVEVIPPSERAPIKVTMPAKKKRVRK